MSESALYTEDIDWRRVVIDTVIPNSTRVYVTTPTPSTRLPEVTSPLDALTWDAAGDVVAHRAVPAARRRAGCGSGSAP
ncbi:proteasome accessory factor PafA2 family protein [Kocuria rhizophila]|nr:proteasome accessory factor PafA2 family protein [Kocuria rhizophila]